MSSKKIENGRYWNIGWQIIDGCTPCSPGCDNCWSAARAHRFFREGEPGHTGGVITDEKGRFDGAVIAHPERLDRPLKRKKPAVYAIWNDLYHESLYPGLCDEVYSVALLCRRHTFLILTKRPHNMAIYWAEPRATMGNNWYQKGKPHSTWKMGVSAKECGTLPLTGIPSVYHGLTVCNQQEADEKIPIFLQVPGKKFLSIEPMLGPIDIRSFLWEAPEVRLKNQDAVILGGETGPKARPMNPDWVRSVRDQCQAAGVPFFFKGWGEYAPWLHCDIEFFNVSLKETRCWLRADGTQNEHDRADGKSVPMYRVGKKAAGRILDGVTHDDLAWVKSEPSGPNKE